MDILFGIIGIAGLTVGIVGLIGAFRERILRNELTKTLGRIENARNAETWTNIGVVATVFDSLDTARAMVRERQTVDYEVLGKIESARRGTVDHYRMLLKEAVLAEPNFSEETIRIWEDTGKLENEWRVRAAKRLLSTH